MAAFLVGKRWSSGRNPTTPEKTRIGETLLTDLLGAADAAMAAKNHAQAAKLFNQASTVATTIKSKRLRRLRGPQGRRAGAGRCGREDRRAEG